MLDSDIPNPSNVKEMLKIDELMLKNQKKYSSMQLLGCKLRLILQQTNSDKSQHT